MYSGAEHPPKWSTGTGSHRGPRHWRGLCRFQRERSRWPGPAQDRACSQDALARPGTERDSSGSCDSVLGVEGPRGTRPGQEPNSPGSGWCLGLRSLTGLGRNCEGNLVPIVKAACGHHKKISKRACVCLGGGEWGGEGTDSCAYNTASCRSNSWPSLVDRVIIQV